ncbi:HAMP domain-containing sensor histidine kinase [Clostridium sp. VAP41]|uniref:sensor histidine kinase n=1 Tax=Clostridium sp. VAP41 TaxID=2949979 RepID=UPI00207A4593|nr:HAMP domain-containing sensor histidine kinase [Clostridium sp. VAP41]
MFRKLKQKFMLLNMIMISIVMLSSFSAIYIITFSNIQNQNKLKLENVSSATLHYLEIYNNTTMINSPFSTGEYIQDFGVIIDEQGKNVFDSSFGTISKYVISEGVKLATQENKEKGKILLGNKQYQYSISLALVNVNATDESTENTFKAEQLYQIAFLDITESQKTLSELLLNFIIIGSITLVVIWYISVYFAKRSIIPIEQSYIKQKQFIQDASHELKTPLASIGANLDAVTSNPKETVESQQKWIGYIYYEKQRMNKLINDLLYLAKTDTGELANDLSPVNFSETTEHSILSMETIIYEKGIQFSQKIEADIIINAYKDKIEQIIKILLDNATKYVNSRGSIEILLYLKRNQAILSVSNTGEGISKEHIERIFERFYRVDVSRKHIGSYGLGLPIAKSLVESMKGEISVSSIENEKTTFIIKFPCK